MTTIAIDGQSSTGKSSLAKSIASHFGFVHIDSGAMYRAVSLFAIRNNCFDEDQLAEKKLLSLLPAIEIEFQWNDEAQKNEITLNGEKVDQEIRSMEVSEKVSQVAKIPQVRKKMVQLQRELGQNKSVVMDGRDIGTVVFPEATLKIYLQADNQVRAQRRYDELKRKGVDVNMEDVLKNINNRDLLDMQREHSPLKKATDARMLDNTYLNEKETLEKAISWVKEVLE